MGFSKIQADNEGAQVIFLRMSSLFMSLGGTMGKVLWFAYKMEVPLLCILYCEGQRKSDLFCKQLLDSVLYSVALVL